MNFIQRHFIEVNAVVALAAVLLPLLSGDLSAQEYLDTAGRWKTLTLPSGSTAIPRAMVALRGHVVIGREGRSLLVSRDSGETWRNTGDALPSGVAVVWALAHPDTGATPNRILGVASTAGSPVRTRTIESLDGGTTWRDGVALPELDVLFTVALDTMRLYGPPNMFFVPNAGGAGRTGFIYSAAGLLATTDNGATWTRRGAALAIRSMTMADESNGIAALGEYQQGTKLTSTAGGIYWTSDGGVTWTKSYSFSDGGFFQYISLRAFSATSFRAFVPERFQNYMDWRLLRSDNGGRTWDEHRGRQARRPLYGLAVWRDTTDVHVVTDGAILQHSGDGGEQFYLLRDTAAGYWQTPLDEIAGYVTRAPIAASDGRYLYYTVPGNRAARWRMASVEPRSSTGADPSRFDDISIFPHPVNGSARISVGGTSDAHDILIVDALGAVRTRLVLEDGTAVLIQGSLAPGRYFAVTRGRIGLVRRAFVVVD